MKIRPSAVADLFYPADAAVLQHDIQHYLSAVTPTAASAKAIIVPHAGYIYSGQTAAYTYAQLQKHSEHIRRVVLLGPCHRVPLHGLAVPSADCFATPFDTVTIDRQAINTIMNLTQVQEFDLSHEHEHSLEVQLPFLQQVLDEFTLVPLVVGTATAQQVQQVLELLWGGDETRIIISSDLSHYHNYDTARMMDAATCDAIESLDGSTISDNHACGRNAILGLLKTAQHRALKVSTLDLCNSGDTAGDKDRVVGYGAWMFTEN